MMKHIEAIVNYLQSSKTKDQSENKVS